MTRLKKNFIVDLLSYVGFVILLGTGLVLKYVLPHGSGLIVGRGTGRASGEKLITTLWGMTGEQWVHIHFWAAVAVLVVLVFHLVLHWRWIACVIGGAKKPADSSGTRAFLGLTGMLGIFALVLLPLLTPTEQVTRNQLLQEAESRRSVDTSDVLVTEADDTVGESEHHDISIHGSMTLLEVQDMTGVSYKHILEELDLPEDTSPSEKLGRLRRAHGFTIDDVRRIVKEHMK